MWKALIVGAVLAVVTTVSTAPRAATGVSLAIDGRTNATPTIAAREQFVAVVWGASPPNRSPDVYAAVSHDSGRTFAAPVRVSDGGASASLSGEQPPHVVLVPRDQHDPDIVVLWTSKSSAGTRLLVARSDNGGTSFGVPAPIAASEAAGNRGWESTTVTPDGRVVAVWLDHRELANTGMTHHHEGHDASAAASTVDGSVRAQPSKLYISAIDDASTAQAITGGVCYCCKTSVIAGPDGAIYAAWRHVYPGNVRDIAFTSSHDGGRQFTPPVRVSNDHWQLDGCPENGPTLALTGAMVHVVWPTLVSQTGAEPALALFHAASRDGLAFSPRQRIPTTGTPRHPQLLATRDGSLALVWDEELDGGRRRLRGAVLRSHGSALDVAMLPLENATRAEYPVIADTAAGLVVASTSGEADHTVIHVMRVPH